MINDYIKLQEKYTASHGSNTIVLMQVGSFYESYAYPGKGYDLHKISQMCNIQITKKNKSIVIVDESNPYMLGFPSLALKKFLKILTNNCMTVVVYNQVKKGSKHIRVLDNIYTYATYVDDIENPHAMLDTKTSVTSSVNSSEFGGLSDSNLMALYRDSFGFSVATLNLQTGASSVTLAYKDSNEQMLSCLERQLRYYPTREIVYIDSVATVKSQENTSASDKEIDDFIQSVGSRCRIYHVTDKKKKTESVKCEYQNEVLSKVFDCTSSVLTPIEELELERYPMLATAYVHLIDYVYMHNERVLQKIQRPVINTEEEYMVIENDAVAQLNIIESNQLSSIGTKKFDSVFSVINACCTVMGKKYLREQLLRPLTKVQDIVERLDASIEIESVQEELRRLLTSIVSTENLSRRMALGILNPYELHQIVRILRTSVQIGSILENQCNAKFLSCFCVEDMHKLCQAIDTRFNTVELENFSCEQLDQNYQIFQPGVNAQLESKIKELNILFGKYKTIEALLNDIVRIEESKSKGVVKLAFQERDGYYFETTQKRSQIIMYVVKNDYKRLSAEIRKEESSKECLEIISKLEHRKTGKGSVVRMFCGTGSGINESRIYSLGCEIKEMICNVWKSEVQNLYANNEVLWMKLSEWIAKVDFIQSNVHVSKKYGYVRPQIVSNVSSQRDSEKRDSEKSWVSMKGMRHPLIERLVENSHPYVAHDISLGLEKDGILLYGINSVGKSSVMKAIGINVLMAQAGLFVPCREMQICPYTTLFTRITGNDNLFRAQSSFSLELMEIRTILKCADQRGLVIGDEVCRGTETLSANSIVSTMLCFLAKRRTSFIFATHLHDLGQLPDIRALTNMSTYHLAISMQGDKLVFDRELKPGSGDSFYGLMIAREIIQDREFIEHAERISKYYKVMEDNKNASKINTMTDTDIGLVVPNRSKYNKSKYVTECERCKTRANLHTHHKIFHQSEADTNRRVKSIQHLNVDSKWNLECLCKDCHAFVHVQEDLQQMSKRNNILKSWQNNGMDVKAIEKSLKEEYDIQLSTSSIRRILREEIKS